MLLTEFLICASRGAVVFLTLVLVVFAVGMILSFLTDNGREMRNLILLPLGLAVLAGLGWLVK